MDSISTHSFDFSCITVGDVAILSDEKFGIFDKVEVLNKYFSGDLMSMPYHPIALQNAIKFAVDEFLEFGDKYPDIPDVWRKVFEKDE